MIQKFMIIWHDFLVIYDKTCKLKSIQMGEGQSMKKKVIFVIVILFLIVGIPLIINELYKVNSGYITMWGASEVLSYYGTILGAGATIIAVYFTIHFTQKQICYETKVQQEKQKWEQVDKLLRDHFKLAMPTEIMKIYSFFDYQSNPNTYIEKIRLRTVEIKTSLDWIKTYLDPEEYENILNLIDEILIFDDSICDICSKVTECLHQFNINEVYQKNKDLLEKYQNILSDEQVTKYRNGMLEHPYVEPEELAKKLSDFSMQLIEVHGEKFQKLLNMKREVFKTIHQTVNSNEQKKLKKLI